MSRTIFPTATAALFFATASLLAGVAHADPLQKPDAVQGHCNDDGDTYFPPSTKGVYACLKKDGSGIVCGGYTEEYKKSCDAWRADGTPASRSPSAVVDAAKKKKAEKAAADKAKKK
jgi:hypothetical protein